MLTAILIALGLNFDTFSVSVIQGTQQDSRSRLKESLKAGVIFGATQALFALMGSMLGIGFKAFIVNIDHWIAFVLLSGIGLKMMYEIKQNHTAKSPKYFTDTRSLIGLAIATSIDALIVGITFVFLKVSILTNVCIIGFTTFVVSYAGFYAGKKLTIFGKNKMKLIGGVILILIGIKILIKHLYFPL